MNRLRWLVVGIIGAIIALDIVLVLLPTPSFAADPAVFRLQILIVSSFSLNFFAAAVLFLYGMRDFKPDMRRSYQIITWSMVFFGVVNLQYPTLVYARLLPEPWTSHGGSLLIVIPGMILHYWGVRHFARAVGVATPAASLRLVLGIWLGLSLVAVLLPHRLDEPAFWYYLHQLGAAANITWNAFTFIILLKMLRVIGQAYRVALRWLAAGGGLVAVGFVHVLIAACFGLHNAYNEQGPVAAPFIAVAVCYLIAGYYFCTARFYQAPQVAAAGRALLDAVMMAASLVSNRGDIDAQLAEVRGITAGLSPTQPLPLDDQQRLGAIYLSLEDYLVHHERIRTFSQAELRAQLSDEAQQLLAAQRIPGRPFTMGQTSSKT
ncbi:MAG TPA: hypothetical protein VLI05_03790 [Candidatus Saccharimonadia bacterium]|nr:hypothetical protein [Candidatus Saccharimonadia bacterium]